jgi:glycosyltransferase involved in cell wall biosynthesis
MNINKDTDTVCLIGMFPPPLTGMTFINEKIKYLLSNKSNVVFVNHSSGLTAVNIYGSLFKLLVFPIHFLKFFYLNLLYKKMNIYISISGQYGQIYDVFFILISRLFGRKLFIHHHSYRYINNHSSLMEFLVFASSSDASHVVACDKMSLDLNRQYPIASSFFKLSGIFTVNKDYSCTVRNQLKSVGFLSNLTLDKGVDDFIEIAEAASNLKLPIQFILAGPFFDKELEILCVKRINRIANLKYIGAISHDKKKDFFDSIDLFIFPTRHKDESEGIVILEALSFGIPVIAKSRGCIEDILKSFSGYTIKNKKDFISLALNLIQSYLKKPSKYTRDSKNAYSRFVKLKKESFCDMEIFLDNLCKFDELT